MRPGYMPLRLSMPFKLHHGRKLLPSKVLLKYTIISLLSFGLDFLLFTALHLFIGGLFIPLITARIISAGFNFYQNKITVYRAHKTGRVKREIISYFLLAGTVFGLGYFLISFLVLHLGVNIIIAKVIIDAVLFFSNYLVQKMIIFSKRA